MYNISRRRHGWQHPLHPLQILGMALYTLLIVAFYCFISPFLGNRIANIVILTTFTSLGVSVMVLFIRCTATDPSDNHHRKTRKLKHKSLNFNYGFLITQLIVTTFRRIERKILKTCIKRKYPTLSAPQKSLVHLQQQPLLLPFPFIDDSDSVSPQPICFFNGDDDQDISFCSLCNLEVKKHSKHCRTCNRCVEGFDHHCRWLNNCVGKKNYTTFILLMISLLLMLMMEGGSSIVVFIRCFADKKHIEQELSRQFHIHARFPRGVLAAISVVLVLVTGYGTAALAQLFLFHLLLIRKGMRTYDYILAMKAQNQFSLDLLQDDSDFSSDDDDDDDDDSSCDPPSPTTPIVVCKGHRPNLTPGRLSVRIDLDKSNSNPNKAFRAGIDPWTLIQMSREKAFMATELAKERLANEKQTVAVGKAPLNPLPSEIKSGPLINSNKNLNIAGGLSLTPLIATGRILGSSSPRHRRFSGSPATLPNQTYKTNFDLKLTEMSQELESYISRQVLSTVLKDGTEASPR